jgi:hypothetical protein
MIRLALCLFLISGASMAKDGMIQAPKRQAAPSVPVEQDDYMTTPEGKDLEATWERIERGEVDFDTALRQFRQKWYNGKAPSVETPEYSIAPKVPQKLW